MPTENEELIPITRDINLLLTLETYQGMSDAEIEEIISFRIKEAVDASYNEEKIKLLKARHETAISTYETLESNSNSVLQSALSQTIPFVSVSSDGTVIQNV